MRRILPIVLILCALWTRATLSRGEAQCPAPAPKADELVQRFAAPPEEAKPWVYWFFSSGNITKEGITADLEAMKRVGIAGVIIMEVDVTQPQGPARFMGPQWRELFKFMLSEAKRIGIEVNMNNDAGWCGSGGPWITPEHSMQHVVWSETEMAGSKQYAGTLRQPTVDKKYNYYQRYRRPGFSVAGGRRPAHGLGQTEAFGEHREGL